MKLLFENWKKYLKEVEQKTKIAKPKAPEVEPDEYASPYKYEETDEEAREKYFGKDPSDLLCIERLKDPKEYLSPANFYKCMDDAGYEKISAGSFRWVFEHPDDPSLVFKMVAPNHFLEKPDLKGAAVKRAMEMNRKEATGAFQTTSELVPKVYDSAKDYFWIISEKVTPIESWREMQTHFPAWKEESEEDFEWWFQQLINPKIKEDVAIRELDKPDARASYVKSGRELVNDPLILKIRDLLAQWDLPSWDIRPHNVGYATRNGKKQFVILDPGFELAPDTKESQPEDSKAFSDLFKDKYAVTAPQKPNIMENWRQYLNETEVGIVRNTPVFSECFHGKEKAFEPLLDKTLEIIEMVINRNINDWPQTIECMSEEEIKDGKKEGGGHGLYMGKEQKIKINPNMDVFNIYLNFIHENFHHAKPELIGPKYSKTSRHIEINESLMGQVIEHILYYIKQNKKIKEQISDDFIIALETYE